jgi:hypothetical protein
VRWCEHSRWYAPSTMRMFRAPSIVLAALLVVVACDDESSTEEGSGGGGQGAHSQGGGAQGGGAQGGGAQGGSTTSATGGAGGAGAVTLPTANVRFDYQLGGAYSPPTGVEMVVRDREAAPATGLYSVCYVNGFQAQQDEDAWWLANHPTLVLRNNGGQPIIDPDWDEMLLDTSTADKRAALAGVVGDWIAGCGASGFMAVEIDNLDSYTRSQGKLSQQNAVDFMALLSARAHGEGMAIAQKNSTEIISRRAEMGTDFAIAEECNRYSECQDYVDGYGDLVFVIEYRQQDFNKGCADFPNLSVVYRDLDLVPAGDGGYLFDDC